MNKDEAIKMLKDTLEKAHAHLEYCNYGDRYEKECAVDDGLPERITAALDIDVKELT